MKKELFALRSTVSVIAIVSALTASNYRINGYDY